MASLQMESLEMESIEDTLRASVSTDNSRSCIICCTHLTDKNSTRLTCCGQLVHTPCMNRHGNYARREYQKHHQTLHDFQLFCILCKQPCDFEIEELSGTFSFPSSIPSLPSMSMPSVSLSLDFDTTHSDSDPSYEPGTITATAETRVSSDHKLCLVCSDIIISEETRLKCCSRVVHAECRAIYVSALKTLGLNSVYRGAACVSCSISRQMVNMDFDTANDFLESDEDTMLDLHPLGCSPNAHYLLSVVVLHIYGFKFHNNNPWFINPLMEKYPEIVDVITILKRVIIQSEQDIIYVRGIVSNIRETRNVFISPDVLCDIINRAGDTNVKALMDIIGVIQKDTIDMFNECYVKMKKNHDDLIMKIKSNLTELSPPRHMCLNPICSDICTVIVPQDTVEPLSSMMQLTEAVHNTAQNIDPMDSPPRQQQSHQASHFPNISTPVSPIEANGGNSPRNNPDKKDIIKILTSNMFNDKFNIDLAEKTLRQMDIIDDIQNWDNVTPLLSMVIDSYDDYNWNEILAILGASGADIGHVRKKLRI